MQKKIQINEEQLRSGLPIIFRGKLCNVEGYGEGKTIHLKVIRDEDKDSCPHCDKPITTRIFVLEHSPLFQSEAVLLEEKQYDKN